MPHAPASRGRLGCRGGLTVPYYFHRWLGHPSTHPHPLLFCGDDSLTPQRTSEPSYSSTRGHPLPTLPCLRAIPFLSLTVVHRRGALGAAWSMWSTIDFHRKCTICGEADSRVHGNARKCLLIMRKIIIPPPDSRDPPDGPPYFMKKTFPPHCWDPPNWPAYFAKKTFPPMSARTHRKCLLITHKKMNTPPASWDPPWWEADLWAY